MARITIFVETCFMNVTDIEILKKFSKDWEEVFGISDVHQQEKYGKPLDKELVLDLLEDSKWYGFDEDIPAIKQFIKKCFSKGNETYDVCSVIEI